MILKHFSNLLLDLLNLASDRQVIQSLKPTLGLLAGGGEVDILDSQFDEIGLGRLEPIVAEPRQGYIPFLGQVFLGFFRKV